MKKFLYKDKTGRGWTNNNLTLEDILAMEDDTDDFNVSLHMWAKNAVIGDEWEDAENKYTCIDI